MVGNPYQSPSATKAHTEHVTTASPLAARVVAVVLFMAAAGGATVATLLGLQFGLRGLPPEEVRVVNLIAAASAVGALACTVLGFLVLMLAAKPVATLD